VAIAELDPVLVESARADLGAEAGERLLVIPADVGDEASVRAFVAAVVDRFGKVDAVINNATFSPAGTPVVDLPVDSWDRSYAVNLRVPVLLARACLPAMIARRHGAFVCVSSTGGPFLAAYETLKAAQLALANSLDAELENSGVFAFTIGPGLVPTRTALAAIERLAPRLGMTVEEFWKANGGAVVSVEAAGAGFAAAVALAQRYAGQEISSSQALMDAGIELPPPEGAPADSRAGFDRAAAGTACAAVRATLVAQAAGWRERSFFERQWMQRDFKQRVGMPVERCLEFLASLQANVGQGVGPGAAERAALERLAAFYTHMGELARGYVKDEAQREEQLRITAGWVAEVQRLAAATSDPPADPAV